jgi:hypothetical protein
MIKYDIRVITSFRVISHPTRENDSRGNENMSLKNVRNKKMLVLS